MSFKAKDLQFDNSEPAFLRRIRGELSSGKRDSHDQPIARNKRMKQDDDDDDAPTYVLEDTNQSLTRDGYDALVSGKESKEQETPSAEEPKEAKTDEDKMPKDKIAEVGANKKRKIAKVISVDQEPSEEAEKKDAQTSNSKPVKKQKKKAKAVKLAFEDEEA